MGQRASDTRAVVFEAVEVPVANRLGEEGEGFKIAMFAFEITRPLAAAGAVGLARAAFEHALRQIQRLILSRELFKHWERYTHRSFSSIDEAMNVPGLAKRRKIG